MLDDFLQTLQYGPPVVAYVFVAFAAGIEYLVPPLPGDTVALFAVAMAVRAELNWVLVYLSLTVGAVAGGLVAWAFGVWLDEHEDDWPAVFRRPSAERTLAAVRRGYGKYGAAYLVMNRFLPALRAFFFVGAGLSGMNAGAVVLYGGLSAALWNAGLLGIGYALGKNWEALRTFFETYTAATMGIVAAVILVWLLRAALRRA